MNEATHESPAWRDRADFIIAVKVADIRENAREQLWARQLGERLFELCCIPFFAYQLALGDLVRTDVDYVVEALVRASGHKTFRVWLGRNADSRVKGSVEAELRRRGVLLEWSSRNLVAASAPTAQAAEEALKFLGEQQQRGRLEFEEGN